MEDTPELNAQMLKRRVIMFVGNIDDKLAGRVTHDLLQLQLESSEPAYLLIDSTGGSTNWGLQLFDTIEYLCGMEVYGVALGDCMSAATFVFLACKKRLALPHARFLTHSGSMSNITLKMDDLTAEKLRQLQEEVAQHTQRITSLYREKLNKPEEGVEPEERIKKYLARGDQQFNAWISAQEALEIGLVTEIVKERLPFFLLPPETPSPS